MMVLLFKFLFYKIWSERIIRTLENGWKGFGWPLSKQLQGFEMPLFLMS